MYYLIYDLGEVDEDHDTINQYNNANDSDLHQVSAVSNQGLCCMNKN